jgi:hypothetical protein
MIVGKFGVRSPVTICFWFLSNCFQPKPFFVIEVPPYGIIWMLHWGRHALGGYLVANPESFG